MVNIFLKRAIGVAVLAGVSVGANATTTALGEVSTAVPTTFTGSVLGAQQSFSDIFTFTLSQPNMSSGYSAVNFPLNIPEVGSLGTVLSTMSLVTFGADGMQGTADDQVLKSVVLPSAGNTQDHLGLSWDQPITGPAYLNIAGVTSGTLGGIYSGSISVSAVPEPETYAMLLAGLGLMGAVVRRRSSRKTS
ncbi:MAG: FxDxF family PEP-CTERM protein [Nitrosospira sp.]